MTIKHKKATQYINIIYRFNTLNECIIYDYHCYTMYGVINVNREPKNSFLYDI